MERESKTRWVRTLVSPDGCSSQKKRPSSERNSPPIDRPRWLRLLLPRFAVVSRSVRRTWASATIRRLIGPILVLCWRKFWDLFFLTSNTTQHAGRDLANQFPHRHLASEWLYPKTRA